MIPIFLQEIPASQIVGRYINKYKERELFWFFKIHVLNIYVPLQC